MAAEQSPTLRRRRLGMELRRLRDANDLTMDEVAQRLEWSAAKVSRIETAKVAVRPRDVKDLLDIYRVTDERRREEFLTLTRESRRRGWWDEYRYLLPVTIEHLVAFETEAVRERIYTVSIVPGLLQTEEYAHEVISRTWLDLKNPAEIQDLVNLRLDRQRLLTRHGRPIELHAILDESALRRRVGGPSVMMSQLRHLADAAFRLPNLRLQVLAFAAGAHASIDGSFTLLDFSAPDEQPSVVHLDSPILGRLSENRQEVEHYERAFEDLERVALGVEESLETIRVAATKLQS